MSRPIRSPSMTIGSSRNSRGSGSCSLNCTSRLVGARSLLRQQRVAADERHRLVERAREAEAGLERRVLVADVVPPVAIRLLEAQRIEGMEPGERQPIARRLGDHVEHRPGELGRDVQLEAELADVGDALRAHQRIAELDLLRESRTGTHRWPGRPG